MATIKCRWCQHEFQTTIGTDKDGARSQVKCPKCTRLLPSSIKESTGNIVGRKHIHIDYK